MVSRTYQNPAAVAAGGYVLFVAGWLVVFGLVFHPIPQGGFEEKPSVLSDTPWWGIIHVAIALGFVLCVLGGLLMLVGGRVGRGWVEPFCWGAITVGMIFFTGVSLINGWVMHDLSKRLDEPGGKVVYDAFNQLLIGHGWLGNPLFLLGLTGLSWLEVRRSIGDFPRWFMVGGLIFSLLSWLRGVGSAFGVHWLEFFILANIPAFLWLGFYGLMLARKTQQPAGL